VTTTTQPSVTIEPPTAAAGVANTRKRVATEMATVPPTAVMATARAKAAPATAATASTLPPVESQCLGWASDSHKELIKSSLQDYIRKDAHIQQLVDIPPDFPLVGPVGFTVRFDRDSPFQPYTIFSKECLLIRATEKGRLCEVCQKVGRRLGCFLTGRQQRDPQNINLAQRISEETLAYMSLKDIAAFVEEIRVQKRKADRNSGKREKRLRSRNQPEVSTFDDGNDEASPVSETADCGP
jgi:hypothetical protein